MGELLEIWLKKNHGEPIKPLTVSEWTYSGYLGLKTPSAKI